MAGERAREHYNKPDSFCQVYCLVRNHFAGREATVNPVSTLGFSARCPKCARRDLKSRRFPGARRPLGRMFSECFQDSATSSWRRRRTLAVPPESLDMFSGRQKQRLLSSPHLKFPSNQEGSKAVFQPNICSMKPFNLWLEWKRRHCFRRFPADIRSFAPSAQLSATGPPTPPFRLLTFLPVEEEERLPLLLLDAPPSLDMKAVLEFEGGPAALPFMILSI